MLLITDLTLGDWINAAAIALGSVLLAIIIRRITKRRIRRKDKHGELIDFIGRMLAAISLAMGVFYTLRALELEIGPTLGAFGVGALFVAVGLQPLLVNLVGAVVLQARRPFRRGDQILSNGREGTVIDITSTSTVLLSYNGEAIHLPNGQVLSQPMTNWTHEPVRRTILPISVPYGCDLPLVLATLGRAARRALNDENLPPAEALATGFGDHGIGVDLRFWHYSDRLESQVALSQVVIAADQALKDIDVVIPYPQVVMHRGADDVSLTAAAARAAAHLSSEALRGDADE